MVRLITILLLLLSCLSLSAQEVCKYAYPSGEKAKLNKAIEAYEKGHYPEATDILRKLSAKHPKAAEPLFYLGMIAAKENQNPGAIRRYFSKLEDVCPEYPDAMALFYQGVIDYTDERYEEATAHFNRYFELTNSHSTPEQLKVYEEASNYLYWSQFLAEAKLNPVPFFPTVVTGVSSRTDEILPYCTWDGKEYYYIRQVAQRKEKTFYTKMDEKLAPRICMSERKNDTAFSKGIELPAPFNQGAQEGGVTITADKTLLYYSVLNETAGKPNVDIYFSKRQSGGDWGPIESAGLNVNDAKSWDAQPSITPDGQYLYFASNRPGGYGGTDIWYCYRLPNGDWSRAKNLGPAVNTAGNEKCPFIHADGKTLYFSSNGWQGFGGYDMYFINLRNGDQRPTNMGMPINDEGDEFAFGITADGRQGYYSGKSKDNTGVGGYDIFEFELYPDARPEGMKMLTLDKTYDKVIVRRYGADDAVYLNTNTVMVSIKEKNVIAKYKDNSITILNKLTDGKGHITPEGKMAIDLYADFLIDHPAYQASIQGPQSIFDYLVNDRKIRKERLSQTGLSTSSDKPSRIDISKESPNRKKIQ